jgi:hypothetical protein
MDHSRKESTGTSIACKNRDKFPSKFKKSKVKYRDAPDTVFAGYPANSKAGYRISGKSRISGRILGLATIFLVKYYIN